MESNNLKTKLGNFLGQCKSEVVKATKIGQSLLGAGFLNDQKSALLKEMGEWLAEQVQSGKLKIEAEYVHSCIEELKKIEAKIKLLDQEIKEIKSPMSRTDDGLAP
jgi:hypothetical protein